MDENTLVLRSYMTLLRKSRPFLKPGDSKIIRKAFEMALKAHDGVRRKSGELYIFHPIQVAIICVDEIGLGTTSIVSALLHDVVEDSNILLSEVDQKFGREVSNIIDGLTKIKGATQKNTSQQAENFKKMILTLTQDVRVILIKLADRLHNMRTLESMEESKQLKIASETKYIYAPLAHRLGLYTIKNELEDLSLKQTDRSVYLEIADKINESKSSRNRFIRNFMRPIKEKLDDLGIICEIKGRPKSINSIYNKIDNKGVSYDEIYDLFAIRIILDVETSDEKRLCWQVYSIITDNYKPKPERLRDWVSTPKANGYESLHTTLMSDTGRWVEVQIRSKRMDDIAEKGYAAHWKYKNQNNENPEIGLESWLSKVREVLQKKDLEAIEFVNDFKSTLYPEEVFTYTPRGELITLPKGATVLDFAFDIHTEIGNKCKIALVNKKLVPFYYELRNGDQIEIKTDVKQKPNKNWLEYVVSPKARTAIKDALKEEKKKFIAKGKEIINRKLDQLSLNFDQETIYKMVNYWDTGSTSELFFLIGTGEINHNEIKKFHREPKSTDDKNTFLQKNNLTKKRSPIKLSGELLIDGGMKNVNYKVANCCSPIPGDPIFGFVTSSGEVSIHRKNCQNAPELLSNYGYRSIRVEWKSHNNETFNSALKIIGIDRIGLINDISKIISEILVINMSEMKIKTEGGIFEGIVNVDIQSTNRLNMIIRKLREIEGVKNVFRHKIQFN